MAVPQRSRSQRARAADDVTQREAAAPTGAPVKTRSPSAKSTRRGAASAAAANQDTTAASPDGHDKPASTPGAADQAAAATTVADLFSMPFLKQASAAFGGMKWPGLDQLDAAGLSRLRATSLQPMQQAVEAMGRSLGSSLTSMAGLSVPPEALREIQQEYIQQATSLWNSALEKPDQIKAQDKRFDAPEWGGSPVNAFMASMYLLNARTLQKLADSLQGDAKARQRVRFAVQQWADAAAPSNFLAFNPEALKKAVETKGESLQQGLAQLLNDLRQGHMSQTDERVFEVGKNVATTAGTVVFENAFFQLIEYAPLTPKVHEIPFLFVPPCINKYYILDLQPDNSVVRYLLSQGHRVFMVSWVNPDEQLAKATWDDYVEQGVSKAIDVTLDIAGTDQANMLGFCVGGTLLATTLATLAAQGRKPAASLTLLTAFLDFADTGIMDVFVDEAMVRMRELTMGPHSPQGGGLMKGTDLAATFSFLRPNDLVWNYVVGNYLKGETPPPFDLLYWNSDSTNLPGPFYTWYLRNTYLENKLKVPGAVEVCGVPLDLRRLDMPTFIYGSREDHIVPWGGAYASTQIVQGPKTFVLGASGHIAGVINPPEKKKRCYWTSSTGARSLPASAKEWMDTAQENPGSWWPTWADWLDKHAGAMVPAPKQPGNKRYQPIEPAPGRYVLRKA
jgi:polyhydroxyalkanoate synthase